MEPCTAQPSHPPTHTHTHRRRPDNAPLLPRRHPFLYLFIATPSCWWMDACGVTLLSYDCLV
jgi:hypothetical protein